MEKIIMYGTILATIIVCVVGILKLPLLKYKARNWFKPLITFITLILTGGAIAVFYFYIKKVEIAELVTLVLSTLAAVYAQYNIVYEGLNIKKLIQTIIAKIRELKKVAPGSKFDKKMEEILPNEQVVDKILGDTAECATVEKEATFDLPILKDYKKENLKK